MSGFPKTKLNAQSSRLKIVRSLLAGSLLDKIDVIGIQVVIVSSNVGLAFGNLLCLSNLENKVPEFIIESSFSHYSLACVDHMKRCATDAALNIVLNFVPPDHILNFLLGDVVYEDALEPNFRQVSLLVMLKAYDKLRLRKSIPDLLQCQVI